MIAHSPHRGRKDGLLEVECWCQHTVVQVPAVEVREGRTRSCGRPRCEEGR